jgi:hypothetical protein
MAGRCVGQRFRDVSHALHKYNRVWSAWSCGIDKKITSAQANFDQDELDYISSRRVHLDHDQRWTAAAGAAYTFSTRPVLLCACPPRWSMAVACVRMMMQTASPTDLH